MSVRIEALLTDRPIDAARLLGRFTDGCEADGAVVTFSGLARGESKGGQPIRSLHLERHPRLTQASLDEIGRDAAGRFDVSGILVVHRWGQIAPRETIVFVATAARHRRAAFLAADFLMDRLKTDAVFWKKEEGLDGDRWIEPTDEDRASLARWEP